MSLTMVVAVDLNWAIGRNNTIPWRLSSDMKRFKALTENKIVVMGRKTWDSLPKKPLPNRQNWVMSRQESLLLPECVKHVRDIDEVLTAAKDQDVMIIGGEHIYGLFIEHIDVAEVTIVHTHVEDADAFCPALDMKQFITESNYAKYKDEKNEFTHSYLTVKRI